MNCTDRNCIEINHFLRLYGRCGHGFWKVLPHDRAEVELRGWSIVSTFLKTPELIKQQLLGSNKVLFFEDVFNGKSNCTMLLGDLIGHADRDSKYLPELVDLVTSICQELLIAAKDRSTVMAFEHCVPALYADRLRSESRIDDWYLNRSSSILLSNDPFLTLADIQGWQLLVNGHTHEIDMARLITHLRDVLAPSSQWLVSLTQGDPTEPNIASPLCWLDFEHAGINPIVAEAANLLWYLAGMGGWLVPTYQPDVYQRSLPYHLAPRAIPFLNHLRISTQHRQIDLSYCWFHGRGREVAIRTVISELIEPLEKLPGGIVGFGAFLSLRILGVIPWAKMKPTDALLCLAQLLECQIPDWSPLGFLPRSEIMAELPSGLISH